LLIADLRKKSAQDAPISLDRPRIRGYAGVPLYSRNGAVIGLVRVFSHSPRNFSRELELLQQAANGVSLAVEHADLQQRSEAQAIKLEVAEQKLADQTAQFNRVKNELEQFAQSVSRNMQEPLRAVANYAYRLAKHHGSKLDEAAQDFIHHATDSAKRMHGLINKVLAYAKIANAESQKCAAVDSSVVLVKVLEQLHDIIRKKGAVITYDRLPVVEADETQMNHLFQNLVANAVMYCDKAVPQVHVTGAKDRGFWSFKVKDNGIGILPEHSEKIFDAFHRLHTEEKYPGSGVGLSLCKRIVEGHGGRIWVESQMDAGATFCFTLPLKPPAKSSSLTSKSRNYDMHAER
jgi:light-regulated signal transduction histidine kinase (bacteriophytochrome)